MVGGTPKPFACTHEGCSMTFTNEDHLNVHQKKHEMDLNLNLGNKTNVFVADQTPTPTRFLRNCEEVGLFQDLQNVNPFEETFRRAVEQVKTGSLPEPDLPTDDTLHTPHVFPLLSEENVYAQNSKSINELPKELDLPKIDNEIFNNENKILKTQKSQDHDYAVRKDENPTKVKLKEALLKNKKTLTVNVNQPPQTIYLAPILETKLMNTHPNANVVSILAPNIIKLPYINTNPLILNNVTAIKPTESVKTTKSVTKETKSNRQDILERNRAAASRFREKRRKWINTLESNYEKVCKQNGELQKEVVGLRNEVVQLKSLLLAHKDCSVTKAANLAERIIIEPTQLVTLQMATKKNMEINTTAKVCIPKLKTKFHCNTMNLTVESKKSVIVPNTAYSDASNA